MNKKRFLLLTSALCLAGSVNAHNLEQCRVIKNDSERLSCYDDASANHPSQTAGKNLSNTGNPSNEIARFGIHDSSDKQQSIHAKVLKISKDPYKKKIFTLDNGQVWRQSESGSYRIDISQPVTIERGALSAFWLSQAGSNKRLKVKRSK